MSAQTPTSAKAAADPTASDEYVALAATAAQAAKARDTFEQQRDGVQAEIWQFESGIKAREGAVGGAGKKKAANTVGDGTWVVGVEIIANDLPGGGLPSVTLAAGQDFKSSRCGTWSKQ